MARAGMEGEVTYEVHRSTEHPDEWNVEVVNDAGEGEIYGASFYGPKAEERAREYAAWKNDRRRNVGPDEERQDDSGPDSPIEEGDEELEGWKCRAGFAPG